MIRFLKQDEKPNTRKMYETMFWEDSQEFVDYYYRYKIRDNQILVMEEEGIHQVMLHLNPYEISFCGQTTQVNYIVAVATEPAFRRQGKMAEVMAQALLYLDEQQQPFTFLIPAAPRVYQSAGFRFLPESSFSLPELFSEKRKMMELRAAEMGSEYVIRSADSRDIGVMAAFANRRLRQQYDLYIQRDEAYYERLLQEMKCQDGGIVLIEAKDGLTGIFTYGRDGSHVEIQEALYLPGSEPGWGQAMETMFPMDEVSYSKMHFMARIVNLDRMVLFLRSKRPRCLRMELKDSMIPKNNGCFELKMDASGSSIRRILPKEAEVTMEVGELSEYLFQDKEIFIREWV